MSYRTIEVHIFNRISFSCFLTGVVTESSVLDVRSNEQKWVYFCPCLGRCFRDISVENVWFKTLSFVFQSSWTQTVERAVSSAPEEKRIHSLVEIHLQLCFISSQVLLFLHLHHHLCAVVWYSLIFTLCLCNCLSFICLVIKVTFNSEYFLPNYYSTSDIQS